MENRLRITGINYLNTKPFLWGLVTAELPFKIDLQLDSPSNCAQRLHNGDADIGLIPIAALPSVPNATIISDYCIGSVGAVDTVSLFSEVPLDEITHIYLDYQSMTSNQLARVLCAQYWKIQPKFIQGEPDYEQRIGGTVAGIIIGDRVFEAKSTFRYNYDLSLEWQKATGKPFVFAVWVSRKKLAPAIIDKLNQCFRNGITNIEKLLYILPNPTGVDLSEYLQKSISYELDDAKKEALLHFFTLSNFKRPVFEH